jgi:flagellar biosynthesis/type III secretory pathway protein FliH
MTEKALAPMESFLERVKSKLRDDIGSLIPDEVLQQLVQRTIEDEFFKKGQKNIGTGYNPVYETVPSEFQKIVLAAVTPIMEKHALLVAERHAAEIEAQIKESVENGLITLAMRSLDRVFAQALESQGWHIQQVIENALRSKGLVR